MVWNAIFEFKRKKNNSVLNGLKRGGSAKYSSRHWHESPGYSEVSFFKSFFFFFLLSPRLAFAVLLVSRPAPTFLLDEVSVLWAIVDEAIQIVCVFGGHADDKLAAVLGVGVYAPAQTRDAPVGKQGEGWAPNYLGHGGSVASGRRWDGRFASRQDNLLRTKKKVIVWVHE